MNIEQKDSTLLVAGTIRNGAAGLEISVLRLSTALCGFKKLMWLLVESDSSDETISRLTELSSRYSDFNFVSLGSLRADFPKRTERLAHARNVYLEEFQLNPRYSECNYLMVADLDGVNNLISREGIDSSWKMGEDAAITANQSGPYYDIWALRHPLWSPNDCWSELEFFKSKYRWPESALQKSVLSRMIKIDREQSPIEVLSAFGGMAIYPRNSLYEAKYVGLDPIGREVCEHISISEKIRENGYKIFINPKMINTKYTEFSIEKKFSRKTIRILRYPYKVIQNYLKIKTRSSAFGLFGE